MNLRSLFVFVLGLIILICPPLSAQTSSKSRVNKPSSKSKAAESSTATDPSKDEHDKAKSTETKPTDSDEEEAEDTKKQAPSRGFLGDTKRFSRMGGWGSMGGTIGQFGMARTALITMPPVQEELKLTAKQKADVKTWLESLRTRGEEMGKTMREQMGDPAELENQPITDRIFLFTQIMSQVSQLLSENENGLAKILTQPQRKRLNQLSYQMEGIAALVKPEVIDAIQLGEEQAEEIHRLLAQARLMQMTTWITQGPMMRGGPRGQDPRGQNGQPQPDDTNSNNPPSATAKKEQTKSDSPEAQKGGTRKPTERELAMRKQMETIQDRNDRIQEEMTQSILKVLNKRQRSRFDAILGPPFDPSAINNLQRPRNEQQKAGER